MLFVFQIAPTAMMMPKVPVIVPTDHGTFVAKKISAAIKHVGRKEIARLRTRWTIYLILHNLPQL
jgi:hypothetical protein